MAEADSILGVVLAGGRSSRMRESKALLTFRGKALVQHMRDLLMSVPRVSDTVISGDVEGFDGVPDDAPFDGPARAMRGIAKKFPHYAGYLFVPVDMPLLDAGLLSPLLACARAGFYSGMPLPSYFSRAGFADLPETNSVHAMLAAARAETLVLTDGRIASMINANTPAEWERVRQA